MPAQTILISKNKMVSMRCWGAVKKKFHTLINVGPLQLQPRTNVYQFTLIGGSTQIKNVQEYLRGFVDGLGG